MVDETGLWAQAYKLQDSCQGQMKCLVKFRLCMNVFFETIIKENSIFWPFSSNTYQTIVEVYTT